MKIIHISPYFPPSLGGIEIFCRELATRTAKIGHDVHVITFTSGNLDDESSLNIHRIEPIFSIYKAKYSPQVKNLIKEIDPDIVHIQSPAPVLQEFSFVDGINYISTFHNDLGISDKKLYQTGVWLYKKLIFPRFVSKINTVISPSQSFKDTSELMKLIPEEKKKVIFNGVDVNLFTPPKDKDFFKKSIGLSSTKVGIFVANMEKFHAYKGLDILIKALNQLQNLDFQFIFVGDGALRPYYETMADALIKKGKVFFLGSADQKKLVDYYSAADFLVLPSMLESFGIVLIEAMACGLPVIVTDIPGPSEIVQDGINGFKVKQRTPQAFADAIKLILDLETIKILSENSRKIVVEKYGWEQIFNSYLKEYSLLLK